MKSLMSIILFCICLKLILHLSEAVLCDVLAQRKSVGPVGVPVNGPIERNDSSSASSYIMSLLAFKSNCSSSLVGVGVL